MGLDYLHLVIKRLQIIGKNPLLQAVQITIFEICYQKE
jgi:hypothetical protein